MLEIYPYKEKEVLEWLNNKLDYLATHNKNYTKKQYYAIIDIQTVLKNLKIKEVKQNGNDLERNSGCC